MMRLLSTSESRRYEPVRGERPAFVLDAHADGVHLALMAVGSPDNLSGVWERPTGRLVWAPDDTQGLCWLPGGAQVLALRGAATGAQVLARGTWPGQTWLRAAPLRYDGSWTDGVVASPRGDLAAVAWLEQHKGGVELFALEATGDRQLPGAGYERAPNHLSRPVFSPDGRYLVLGAGDEAWWNDTGDAEAPAPGGRRRVGVVWIKDLDAGTSREHPIEVDVPTGWLPSEDDPPPETHELQPIGAARFESDAAFSVPLITGGRRHFLLPRAGEHAT